MRLDRFLKETEREKISNELLNKLIPMDVLNSYFLFGYAEALNSINTVINQYEFNDKSDQEFFKELVDYICLQNPEIKTYYDRLTK